MSADFDNLDAPPAKPFYEPAKGPKKKRKGGNNGFLKRKVREERASKALAEELSKPVERRTGKLRSMKAGDFTKEEVEEIKRRFR